MRATDVTPGLETAPPASVPRSYAGWFELAAGALLGSLLYNLHVTAAGNALASLSLLRPQTQALLYLLCGVLGLLLAGGAVALGLVRSAVATSAWRAAVAGAVMAVAAVLALALDYKDGPVATVRLAVFVTVCLAAVRSARLLRALHRELLPNV